MAAVKNPLYATPQKSLLQAGLCALKGKDMQAADDYLRQADRALPDNPPTLLGLAQLAYAKGDLNGARSLLLRESRLGNPSPESLWLNVRVEHKLGNSNAENDFSRSLKGRFPDSEEAKRLAKGQFD
jgi:type IV pilus assembly protein PilF